MRATIHRTGAGRDRETASGEIVDAATVVDALDAPCRRILRAAGERAVTVDELTSACDVTVPTCYRKTQLLTEVGLLERRVRYRPDGNHVGEFVRRADSVVVELD